MSMEETIGRTYVVTSENPKTGAEAATKISGLEYLRVISRSEHSAGEEGR